GVKLVRLLVEMDAGALYTAEHPKTGKRCALRVLPAELAADPARVRLVREVRIGAAISSPHVPSILDAGVDAETSLPWFSLALGEGEILSTRIERAGPLALPAAKRVLQQLGDALGAVHAAGAVHRRLSPKAIFLAGSPGEDKVMLLELGVGKLLDG